MTHYRDDGCDSEPARRSRLAPHLNTETAEDIEDLMDDITARSRAAKIAPGRIRIRLDPDRLGYAARARAESRRYEYRRGEDGGGGWIGPQTKTRRRRSGPAAAINRMIHPLTGADILGTAYVFMIVQITFGILAGTAVGWTAASIAAVLIVAPVVRCRARQTSRTPQTRNPRIWNQQPAGPETPEPAAREDLTYLRVSVEAGIPYLDFEEGRVLTPDQARTRLTELEHPKSEAACEVDTRRDWQTVTVTVNAAQLAFLEERGHRLSAELRRMKTER